MEYFLSCDWGTSSFRLRLIEISTLSIIAEEINDKGCAKTFELWQQSGKPESERTAFYQQIITEHIQLLHKKVHQSLVEATVVISGMASSTIGMISLPYKEIPFSTDGSDLEVKIIEPTPTFSNKTIIISGVKTRNDVMRGEETKLVGCDSYDSEEGLLFILPGTHSKHVAIKDSKVTGFKSYMTGEFFNLLSKESILSASVESGGSFEKEANRSAFVTGVKESGETNMLHQSFLVRTNVLFNKYSKQENFYYLSGLLIGNELKDVMNEKNMAVVLLGSPDFNSFYKVAADALRIAIYKTEDADAALIKGQAKFV